MPAIKTVDKLPPDIRAWLDEAIKTSHFSGYEAIAAQLKAKGYPLSKTSVHRYGKALKEQTTSETARALCVVAAAIKGADDVEATAQRYLSWVQHGN
jgi:short-subunit dehydrogenase involved in D-alanine esterification of teichoic acids